MSSDENGVTDDNVHMIMYVVYEQPHMSEALSDEAMSFITKSEKREKQKNMPSISKSV